MLVYSKRAVQESTTSAHDAAVVPDCGEGASSDAVPHTAQEMLIDSTPSPSHPLSSLQQRQQQQQQQQEKDQQQQLLLAQGMVKSKRVIPESVATACAADNARFLRDVRLFDASLATWFTSLVSPILVTPLLVAPSSLESEEVIDLVNLDVGLVVNKTSGGVGTSVGGDSKRVSGDSKSRSNSGGCGGGTSSAGNWNDISLAALQVCTSRSLKKTRPIAPSLITAVPAP